MTTHPPLALNTNILVVEVVRLCSIKIPLFPHVLLRYLQWATISFLRINCLINNNAASK